MSLLRDEDEKWAVLETLLSHTVHCVLFQDSERSALRGDAPGLQQEQAVVEETSKAATHPTLLLHPPGYAKEDAGLQYAEHCKRVLGSQHWSSEQLRQEKRILKSYLQQQRQRDESVSHELYCAFEAYALLKLFVLERSGVDRRLLLPQQQQQEEEGDRERARFMLVLHVQLELYSKYFEHAEERKVSHLSSL